jgi:hypothetical protein
MDIDDGLVKCRDCPHRISTRAVACPNCGAPGPGLHQRGGRARAAAMVGQPGPSPRAEPVPTSIIVLVGGVLLALGAGPAILMWHGFWEAFGPSLQLWLTGHR